MKKEFTPSDGKESPDYLDLIALYTAVGEVAEINGGQPHEAKLPYRGTEMICRFKVEEEDLPPTVRRVLSSIPAAETTEVTFYQERLSVASYLGLSSVDFAEPINRANIGFSRQEFPHTEPGKVEQMRSVNVDYEILNDYPEPGDCLATASTTAHRIPYQAVVDDGKVLMRYGNPRDLQLPDMPEPAQPSRAEINGMTDYLRGLREGGENSA